MPRYRGTIEFDFEAASDGAAKVMVEHIVQGFDSVESAAMEVTRHALASETEWLIGGPPPLRADA